MTGPLGGYLQGTSSHPRALFMRDFLRMIAPEWIFHIDQADMWPHGYWGVWCEREHCPHYVWIDWEQREIHPEFLDGLNKFRMGELEWQIDATKKCGNIEKGTD